MSYNPPSASPLPSLWEPGDLPPLPPVPSQPERPTGVTVLAVLNFISAGLSLLLIALALLLPAPEFGPDDSFLTQLRQEAHSREATSSIISGILGLLVCLPIAIGLWRLRTWARAVAIVLSGAGVVFSLCSILSQPLTWGTLISLGIGVYVIIYLLQSHVDAAFEAAH